MVIIENGGKKVEKGLFNIIERRRSNLKEEKNKSNGSINDLISGMSNSFDDTDACHTLQMKMEDQVSASSAKEQTEMREKSIVIAEKLDGVCACCRKNPISLDLFKRPLFLPICSECGKECVTIRVKKGLSILGYLNFVIKDLNTKE